MPHYEQSESMEETFILTQEDFNRFAGLSGDHNPIHVDPAFARGTLFGATVSHGMLLFSRLRGLLARSLPDAALIGQDLKFPNPAYANEPLTLLLSPAIEKEEQSGEAHDKAGDAFMLRGEIQNPKGRIVLEGLCRVSHQPGFTPPAPRNDDPATRPAVIASPAPMRRKPSTNTVPTRLFDTLSLGDTAHTKQVFCAEGIRQWACLANAGPPPMSVPEPLIAGLFSFLLGERLPGHGTNYLKQHMNYLSPAEIGEPLTAEVRITRLRADKSLVNLDTRCKGGDGRDICTGHALVLFSR